MYVIYGLFGILPNDAKQKLINNFFLYTKFSSFGWFFES